MRRFRLVVATAALAALVACDGDPGGADPDPTPVTTFPSPDPEPPTEPTTSGTGAASPSVDLPGLPIGGGEPTVVSPTLQCASVAWSGPPELPEGVEVEIRSFSLPPQFTQSGAACPGGEPRCRGEGFRFSASGGTCSVAVEWNGAPVSEEEELLLVATDGRAVCPEQALCDAFLADVATEGAQSIELVRPEPTEDPTDDPTEDPTDDPTEDPTDDPTENPTDGPTESESTGEPEA